MVKIGLALSGGGSRGSFHIGVLAAFDALGIAPSIISGTSAGALVGSLYAAGVKPDQILEIANNVKWYNLLTTSFAKNGITNLNFLENLLTRFIPGNDFKDLKFPFLVTATNMNSGGLEIFETGEVHKPVMASCSVPLLFRPISMNGNKYLDGGIVMNLPVSPLIDRCDIIIASNLFPLVPRQDDDLTSFGNIMTRVLEVTISINTNIEKLKADILIETELINKYNRFELSFSHELFELGYNATMDALKSSTVIPV